MEFSAGLVIGSTRKEIAGKTWMSAMLPAGLALLFTFDHWSVNALSSAMIVAGAISLEKFIPTIPTIKLLGDASYLIYISHHFTLSKLHKLWPQTQLTGELQFYGLMITSLVASSVVGVLGHLLLEKPVTKALQRAFIR